ncbi:MAG: TonB-dependent receptor [Chlorobiota bacterium]
MLRITLIAILSLAFILPQSLSAGIFGTIKGEVTDENGDPAIGASVSLKGTTQGAVVKSNGKYAIAGVRAGNYEVTVSSIGYDPITKKVKVNADQSTVVNFQLSTGEIMTTEIEVTAERLVDPTQIAITTTFDDETIQRTANGNLNSLVTLSSGVTNAGDGFNIRGARANDTQVMVDGMDVGNQFTGAFGVAGTAYSPIVSSYATQEVQVKKGGAGAQYGNSMGGTVNTVVKTGRDDKYEGFLTYRTDVTSLYGSQGIGAELVKNGNNYEIIEGGEGRQLQGDNLNNIEFGVGGPIPGLNTTFENATFYLTGRYETRQFRNSGFEYYAPTIFDDNGDYLMGGENLGQLDNQRSWVKNITGRMRFGLTREVALTVGGQFGQTSLENQGLGNFYMNDIGVIDGSENGIEERIAKINVTNTDVNNVFVKLNHSFPEASAFYELRLSTTINNDAQARRAEYGSDPSFFGGFELLTPQNTYGVATDDNGNLLFSDELAPDQVADRYTQLITNRAPNDNFALAQNGNYITRNPLSGYYETESFNTYRNPYGTRRAFAGHATYGFQYRMGSYMQADGSFTKLIQGDKFEHNIQTGFEFRTYTMGFHNNPAPVSSSIIDVYTSEMGGNIYTESEQDYEVTSQEFNPYRGSLYVQDQISFEGIIITPGLRFDMFNSNTVYHTEYFPLPQRSETDRFADASTKIMISPRLNASYPITQTSVFKMNFGVYYQMPELQFMFDNVNLISRNSSGLRIGNPNIEPQRTNQYQVAYSSALTDDFALDISAYYNDIYNQLGYSYVPDETPYYYAEVGQYGTNKGIEIDLRKRIRDNFGFRIAYTLGSVNGTSNSALSSANIIFDPSTNEPILPTAPVRLNRDITHRLNAIINFAWADEEGPAIGGINFLENSYVTFTGNFRSGVPYTLTEINGAGQLSQINALEGPGTWSIDTRLGKEFKLSDIFGEGMGSSSIELYLDVFNLTNRTAAQGVYSGTQSSLNNGTLEVVTIGSFSPESYFKEGNIAVPGSYSPAQYNQFGERVYFTSGDIDQNGIMTREEHYENYVKALEEITYKNKPLFQLPRRVFFGAVIRF